MFPKRFAPSTSRRAARRAIVVAGCLAGVLVPATAQASPDVSVSSSLSGASTVPVGGTGHGQLMIRNLPVGNEAGTLTLSDVTLVPSCGGGATIDGSCPLASADPNVFTIAPDATGTAGACLGQHFTVAPVDVPTGKLRFTSDLPVQAAASVWASCTISFDYVVNHVPTRDSDAADQLQTDVVAYANLTWSQSPVTKYDAVKRLTVTVQRDTPTLVARALPSDIQTGDAMYATGELTDGTNPDGSMTFSLFAVDAGCSGAPIYSHTFGDITGNGVRQSPDFTAAVPGNYRWQVSYDGDADNEGVTSACSNPTRVSAPLPPPPPPPPPGPGDGGTGGTTPGGGGTTPGGTGGNDGTGGRDGGTNVVPARVHLDRFGLSRRTFARASTSTALAATAAKYTKKKTRRMAKGTTIRYTLSAPAVVTIVVERATKGRRMGTKCVKATKKLKSKHACVRYVKVSTLRRAHKSAGAKKIAFSGRAGYKALAVGSYRMRATASAGAGTTSPTRIAKFKIVKR
ncbi:MAG: hypothetical protein QOJ35_640 [Solirubrobacteraceae bacterium]|nr:hypothetical protein [Solirubrobacteraceae bacterium]